MTTAPCINCSKRELGCHSKCTSYQEFTKQRQEMNKKRMEEYINQYTPLSKRIRKYGGNKNGIK